MGTLAKRLGQLAARSVESESSNIIKTGGANKRGLSKLLDMTLRDSHDMKVFGLGTAASMASRERYCRFTVSMHAIYSAMETHLDATTSDAVHTVWRPFGDSLRRADSLQADLDEAVSLLGWAEMPSPTPATGRYVDAIAAAAESDSATGGARLIGHVYCRYFADLFGGQALGAPYRYALGLSSVSPRHFDFGELGSNRRESIERIYSAINEAGEALGDEERQRAVVAEARVAFGHNVHVYAEEGKLLSDGARGLANMVGGFAKARLA